MQVTQSHTSINDRARDSIKCDVEKQKLKKNEMSDDSDDNFEVIYLTFNAELSECKRV